jgi:hypothetical protein
MEKLIKEFLNTNDGYGYGSGNGNGYGNGNGNGYGSGDGYGDGYGNGNGYGSGDGYGNGYGYGSGDGYGNGYGSGSGSGSGSGNGNGSGNGDGNGYGDGSGDGLKSLNNINIHSIDTIQTQITQIKNNIAKGFIVNQDLTTIPCYIIKDNNYFAHGKTLKEAVKALQDKVLINSPIEKRIANFKSNFEDFNVKIKATNLFEWHYLLTGSCEIGRKSFCVNNNINMKSSYTILEFIELTKNEYKGDIIKLLLK